MTNETENRSIAISISLVLHALLFTFLILFLLKTPNPPLGGGSGVVLNLGYVDEGTGEVQTLNEPNPSQINEENKPSEQQETTPETDSKETPNTSPQLDENTKESIITSEEESDIKTEKKEEKEKTAAEKSNTKKETTKEVIKETQNEQASSQEKNKSEAKALYGQSGTSTKGGNNNGDKEGKVGDQGNPQGDINAKALYGNLGTGGEGLGGSGGSSLDLAGWRWDKIPRVKDENEDENGKLVFQITIDSEGEIINIITLEKTVGPTVEKIYKEAVEKLSFIKTDNKIPAATSTGKITFIIRAK